MEEKGYIKVSLGTVICIFIIIILLVALGVTYYIGFVKDDNKVRNPEKNIVNTVENDETNNVEKAGNTIEENADVEKKPKLQLGKKYQWNEIIEGYNGEKSKNEVSIIFKEDNTFEEETSNAFSEGGQYKGTYKVEENKITLITTKQNGYDGWQDYEENNETVYTIISDAKIKNSITGIVLEIID